MKLNGFWGLLAFVNGQGTDHTRRKNLRKEKSNVRENKNRTNDKGELIFFCKKKKELLVISTQN